MIPTLISKIAPKLKTASANCNPMSGGIRSGGCMFFLTTNPAVVKNYRQLRMIIDDQVGPMI